MNLKLQEKKRKETMDFIMSDLVSTKTELARILGVEVPTLNWWIKRRPGKFRKYFLPKQKALILAKLFKGHIKKEDLRPDIIDWSDKDD